MDVLGGDGGGMRSGMGSTVMTMGSEVVPSVLEGLKRRARKVASIRSGVTENEKEDNEGEGRRRLILSPDDENADNTYILESTIAFPMTTKSDSTNGHQTNGESGGKLTNGSHKHSSNTSCKAGIIISHNSDCSIQTAMIFDPSTETFTIDRTRSAPKEVGFNREAEMASHTLLRYAQQGDSDSESEPATEQEKLELVVIVDKSVIEVFLNGRTALSTRIYTGRDTDGGGKERCTGISVWREDEGVKIERVEVWAGLKAEIRWEDGGE